eukprot:403373361
MKAGKQNYSKQQLQQMISQSKLNLNSQQKTPQSIDKYQNLALKMRKGSSPLDKIARQSIRGIGVLNNQNTQSPSNFYRQNINRVKTSSPGVVSIQSSNNGGVGMYQFNNLNSGGGKQQSYNKNFLIDQQNKLSVDGFSDYSSSQHPGGNNSNFNSINLQKVNLGSNNKNSATQNNFNSNNSRDNTRITVINAHNNSVASTIYNINGGGRDSSQNGANAYTSQMTINESKLNNYSSVMQDVNQNSGKKLLSGQGYITSQLQQQNGQTHKPPMIPSLKEKIYQAAMGHKGIAPQTSKSGNRTNQLTGITGITFDEKMGLPLQTGSVLGDPRSNSRGAYNRVGGYHTHNQSGFVIQRMGHHTASISNINGPQSLGFGIGPLLTSATNIANREEFISNSDIQNIVDFKRKEESCVNEFYYAGLPYMHLNHSQLIHYQDRENINKRIIFSNVEELDRSVSDKNLQFINNKSNPMNYADWLCDMSMKSQRNKAQQVY